MNEFNRQRVEFWLQVKDKSPLRFSVYETDDIPDVISDNPSDKELIHRCLNLTATHHSVNIDDDTETSSGKNRSVLDIWRHVLYYRPEMDIFTVMHELYNLRAELEIYMIYCCIIRRRVFYVITHGYNYEDCGMGDPYFAHYCSIIKDEFGFSFYEWENI